MKALMLPAAALILGILAGTAWTATRWEAPAAVPGDSTAVQSASADPAHAGPAAQDSAAPTQDHAGGPIAVEGQAHPDSGRAAPRAPAPDSMAGLAEPSDSGAATPELAGAPSVPTTAGGAVDPVATPGDTASPPAGPVVGVGADTIGPALDAEFRVQAVDGAKQLARVFAAMQPRDAAAVLGRMSDAEITLILGHIQPRQAASILSRMDADRAALLSRSVLGGGAP